MNGEDAKRIWEEVKANIVKLGACPGPHVFEKEPGPATVVPHYVCAVCRGRVDHSAHRWYNLGLQHGRKPA